MVFKRCSIGTKGPKVCQESTPHTLHPHNQPEPLRQWFSCSLLPNSDPTFWMSQQKSRLVMFLQSSTVQFWWSGVKCVLRVLFLSDRSGTGVVFCCWSPSASGFDVLGVQRCILQTLVGYLSYCCLSIISNQSILLWPLTSTRHFHPHNCHSLDIFSFSDHSL